MQIINNSMLCDMFISAAANLTNHKQEVDNMNVFPVPDGDTGTNMSMTINACVKDIELLKDATLKETSKAMANAALRGARGNSGVILSQLIRGMQKALADKESIDVKAIADICKFAKESAYRAVMKPTEGTILTVARMMAEFATENYEKYDDVESFIEAVCNAGNEALKKTPQMLPQLKQAKVVDSGGQGLMFLIEGALYFIKTGEVVNRLEDDTQSSDISQNISEQADIKFKYCTECIVEKKSPKVDVFKLKSTIEMIGDSMVVVDDEEIVKLHIHTNHPDIILGEALRLGELSSVKIENMKIQHSNLAKNKAEDTHEEVLDTNDTTESDVKTFDGEPKKFGFVCIAAGEGLCDTFKKLGADVVISGGQTMNSSTDEILSAIESINAENVFVFPNNKNIIMAAQQAQDLADKNVFVVPTKSVTQAISCMISVDEDYTPDEMYSELCEVMMTVKSAQTTYAVRDTVIDDREIHTGDILGIVEGKIKFIDETVENSVKNILKDTVDDETGVISLFYGEDVSEETAEALCEELEEIYPECDVACHFGGQPVYHYLISVE